MSTSDLRVVEVAIALVFRGSKLLVTRRPEQVHLGGLWEFPGGKVESGESPEQAAGRELAEETGLAAQLLGRGASIQHSYPTRTVRLHPVYFQGEESPSLVLRGVTDARWVDARELAELPFPEANRSLLEVLLRGPWPPTGSL